MVAAANHSRSLPRFFAAAALALALSTTGRVFLTAGEPGSADPSRLLAALPPVWMALPPLAVRGVDLRRQGESRSAP